MRHEGSQGALSVLLDAVLTRPDDGAGHKTQKNTFRSNVVTGAASGGRFARKACGNVFVGNNLQGNGSDIALIFPDTSGANTVVGNPNGIVDNGPYDCNGDGVNDPNIVTGTGAVLHGVTLGEAVSGAIRTVHGITLQ